MNTLKLPAALTIAARILTPKPGTTPITARTIAARLKGTKQ